jgi:hypothetical protein
MTDPQTPDTTGTARCPCGGWAARWENLTPEDFPDDRYVWKRYRLRAGLKQATVIRWENQRAPLPTGYARLLTLVFDSSWWVVSRELGTCVTRSTADSSRAPAPCVTWSAGGVTSRSSTGKRHSSVSTQDRGRP